MLGLSPRRLAGWLAGWLILAIRQQVNFALFIRHRLRATGQSHLFATSPGPFWPTAAFAVALSGDEGVRGASRPNADGVDRPRLGGLVSRKPPPSIPLTVQNQQRGNAGRSQQLKPTRCARRWQGY